jgi:hypothetical protein
MVDWTPIVRTILFALFFLLTAALDLLIAPTYNNLFVPELNPGALFPALTGAGAGTGLLATAVRFSEYVVTHLVDPAIVLVLLGIAIAYFSRALSARLAPRIESLLPRLVLGVVGANFTLPLASALSDLGRATFLEISGFDGGAWQSWSNLYPLFGVSFSWDNGALALVVTFVLFSLVLLLAIAVAVRDALMAVLLVLLPIFTLLWPIPALAPLARRGWLLFGELAFLPAVMVIPLELAVGAPNILLVLGYLSVSLGSPYLISLARAQLGGLGFPGAGGALTGGVQRGLFAASLGLDSAARGSIAVAAGRGGAAAAGVGAAGWIGRAAMPLGPALAAGHLAGRGVSHLVRHVRSMASRAPSVPAHPLRSGTRPPRGVPGRGRGPR